MKYCTRCGKGNNDSDNFCGYCGEDFSHRTSRKNVMSSERLKGLFTKKQTWILIGTIIGILIVKFFVFGSSSELTQKEFESKLKSVSEGKIDITFVKLVELNNGDDLYGANYEGVLITVAQDKDKHFVLPYIVTIPDGNGERGVNEIILGKYQELITALVGVANQKLSVEERQRLINNDLDFNNQIMTGEGHSTTKNGLKYNLVGSTNSSTGYMFKIELDKK
ncbi:zinc ribbon domain-containing protein [Bacillus cereus]